MNQVVNPLTHTPELKRVIYLRLLDPRSEFGLKFVKDLLHCWKKGETTLGRIVPEYFYDREFFLKTTIMTI